MTKSRAGIIWWYLSILLLYHFLKVATYILLLFDKWLFVWTIFSKLFLFFLKCSWRLSQRTFLIGDVGMDREQRYSFEVRILHGSNLCHSPSTEYNHQDMCLFRLLFELISFPRASLPVHWKTKWLTFKW